MLTRTVSLLILAFAMAGFAWESRTVRPQIDDAYISYRYALNLAEGRGLVFNPGERVEGMTNLAWTVAIAGGLALGVEAPLFAHVLGFASGLALLGCAFGFATAGTKNKRPWLCALAPLPLLASSAFATWTLSGLETPLFVALISAALWAHYQGRMGWATVAAIAACTTRPDGVLAAVVIYASQLLPLLRNPRVIFAEWRQFMPVAGYAGAMLLLTAFRLAYYGSPVPNTFYAKVGGIPLQRGLEYCASFVLDGSIFLLLPVALGARGNKRLVPGLCYVALLFTYTICVGGDVFKNGRFLMPSLPFLAAAAVMGIGAAFDRRRDLGMALLSLLFAAVVCPLFGGSALLLLAPLLLVIASLADPVRERFSWAPTAAVALAGLIVITAVVGGERHVTDKFVAGFPFSKQRQKAHWRNFLKDDWVAFQAQVIASSSPPTELAASTAIGRLGYYSMVPILDILGLVDRHIARSRPTATAEPRETKTIPGHQRSDPDYVFARRPDYIFIPKKVSKPNIKRVPAVLDLWADPRLASLYVWEPRIRAYHRRGHGR